LENELAEMSQTNLCGSQLNEECAPCLRAKGHVGAEFMIDAHVHRMDDGTLAVFQDIDDQE